MIFCADDIGDVDPKPTPLFAAAAAESVANSWASINGWTAARIYSSVSEEYTALTSGAGVFDSSPMRRYTFRGHDAATVLARLTTTPIKELSVGETARGLLLTNEGFVADFSYVARLSGDLFLLTTSQPADRRVYLAVRGFDVEVENIAERVASLALIGPEARSIAASAGVSVMSPDGAPNGRVRGVEVATLPIAIGELAGVEIIYPGEEAIILWDRLRRTGKVQPVGIDALEIVRIEAGAPRIGVDFISSDRLAENSIGCTPDEIGAPHLAPSNRAWFSGRRGLKRKQAQPKHYHVVLAVDADRVDIGDTVYEKNQNVGRVTSAVFSPYFRRALCFAELAAGSMGKPLEVGHDGRRFAARLYETSESRLAALFRKNLRETTES